MLSRVLSPAIGIYSKSQTVLARYQWTDNKSYKDQSYKGPGLNSKFEEEKERREEEEGATTASSHLTVLSKAVHSGPSACDSEREPRCTFAASYPKHYRAECGIAAVCRILCGERQIFHTIDANFIQQLV